MGADVAPGSAHCGASMTVGQQVSGAMLDTEPACAPTLGKHRPVGTCAATPGKPKGLAEMISSTTTSATPSRRKHRLWDVPASPRKRHCRPKVDVWRDHTYAMKATGGGLPRLFGATNIPKCFTVVCANQNGKQASSSLAPVVSKTVPNRGGDCCSAGEAPRDADLEAAPHPTQAADVLSSSANLPARVLEGTAAIKCPAVAVVKPAQATTAPVLDTSQTTSGLDVTSPVAHSSRKAPPPKATVIMAGQRKLHEFFSDRSTERSNVVAKPEKAITDTDSVSMKQDAAQAVPPDDIQPGAMMMPSSFDGATPCFLSPTLRLPGAPPVIDAQVSQVELASFAGNCCSLAVSHKFVLCPTGHQLIRITAEAKGGYHFCDACQTKIPGGVPLLHCATCNYDLCSACERAKEQLSRSKSNLEEEGPMLQGMPVPLPEGSPMPMLEGSPMPGATQQWGPSLSEDSPWSPGLSRAGSLDMPPDAPTQRFGHTEPAMVDVAYAATTVRISHPKSTDPTVLTVAAFGEGALTLATSLCSSTRGGSVAASQIQGPTQKWGDLPAADARDSDCGVPRRSLSLSPTLIFCDSPNSRPGVNRSPSAPVLEPPRGSPSLSPTLIFCGSPNPRPGDNRSPSAPVLERKDTLRPTHACPNAVSPARQPVGLEDWQRCKKAHSRDR